MNIRSAAVIAASLLAAGIGSCGKQKEESPPGGSRIPAQASETVPDVPIDEMPRLLTAPVVYPEEARARGEQGMVYIKALVGKDGRVTEAVVDPNRPAPDVLSKAAVDAVTSWTFEPAQSKGQPVAVWIVVPVNFKLQ